MNSDMFGNLRDWGKALKVLDGLVRAGRLNEHQPGLVRILRYRHNWRLREAVLGCLNEVPDPCEELVRAEGRPGAGQEGIESAGEIIPFP